ncbi:DUF6271 family protein, partial [Streptomyces cinereoruber]
VENGERFDVVERSYRKLGGRYAAAADVLAARRERLLDEARRDMADFALLLDAWAPLVRAGEEDPPSTKGSTA